MTSLLHQYSAITDEEAVSYVHENGPWSRFLLTPRPVQSLVEGVVVLGVGVWASLVLVLSNPWAGVGLFVLALLVALLVAAPGAYTESHREYASHYFAAVRVHGDAEARAYPYPGAAAGAVFGLVHALVRVRRARRTPRT